MKIVCITASEIPSARANSIQVMKACQGLVQAGHDIVLLAPAGTADAVKVASPASFYGLQVAFPLERIPCQTRWKKYDFSWRAVQRARQLDAQAIYVWPLQAALFGALLGQPVLLELHGPPEGKLAPWFYRLFLSLPGKKRLLPISSALLTLLPKWSSAPRRHPELVEGRGSVPRRCSVPFPTSHFPRSPSAVVSPNGVELERYQNLPVPADARRELGLADALTVGYTGHLYPGRGMSLMLDLARRLPQVQFLWVGGDPRDVAYWRAQFQGAATPLPIAALRDGEDRVGWGGVVSNITLTGFVENARLPLYQAAADILIMPYERVITGSSGGNSAAYCSPMKMFEYMACGRAIISSDLPVIREVLNDHNAVLCPPEALEEWERALATLLADPVRRTALARQAQRDAARYTWVARAQRATENFL